MMFLIARKRRCGGRGNPRLGAALGLLSALVMGAAFWIERHDGAHWPIALAGLVGGGFAVLAVLRVVALNRDGRP
jgi:hypothetical protein